MLTDPHAPRAAAIAVSGERVVAIGGRREVRAAAPRGATVVDCDGATIVPGLIDPHLHLFALAAQRAHVDLGGCDSVADVLATITRAAERLPAGAWVRAEGLDDVALGRLPTADELEQALPHHPARLRHRSRHASVLNHRALRALGPCAGLQRRDGHPTGLVSGREERVGKAVGPLVAAELERGLEAAGRDLAAAGLTCVADATPRTRKGVAPLARLMASGRFPIRVFAMRGHPGRPWPDRGRLRCGPVKIMVHEDGAALRPSPAELARRVAAAAAHGAPVAIHCLGSATLVASLAAFAALPPSRRRGHRLEHVAECPPQLVPTIARLGLIVVTNPAFVHLRGDVYRTAADGPPAAWLYRAGTLRRAGVRLAGASDAPVAPANPWLGIAAARARRTQQGVVLGAPERLDARAAFALFTTGAAHALGAPTLGRLTVGGPADLALVEPDPLRAGPDEVAATRVCMTMVAGEIVWQR